MSEYERITERGVPCSISADRRFGGKHEEYYYRLRELEDKIEDGLLVYKSTKKTPSQMAMDVAKRLENKTIAWPPFCVKSEHPILGRTYTRYAEFPYTVCVTYESTNKFIYKQIPIIKRFKTEEEQDEFYEALNKELRAIRKI